MKRVLLLIPSDITFESLSEEQQEGIRAIFGQWVIPMPGTVEKDGFLICDAICKDNFDPAVMVPMGLEWEIIGMWERTSTGVNTLYPLKEIKYTERVIVPEEEEQLELLVREVHKWSGWPNCF